MDVSRITVSGKPVAQKFMQKANPQKVGELIKESIGLAPKGLTSLEAQGISHFIKVPVAKDNFFKIGGLKTVVADLPIPSKAIYLTDDLKNAPRFDTGSTIFESRFAGKPTEKELELMQETFTQYAKGLRNLR